MKIDIFNQKNEKVDAMELSDSIFNVKWNPSLVHQAFLAQIGGSRQPLAHAKGRGEVSGGGKKPWRQKGTGRARHGSSRSPLWIGGGVTFGPSKEKVFAKKINKKMGRLAIFSVLSKKIKDDEFKIIDSFGIGGEKVKTATMSKFLNNVIGKKESALLVPFSGNNISKAVSNIKNAGAMRPQSLNVYDLLKYKNVILEKEAVSEIEKHFSKS